MIYRPFSLKAASDFLADHEEARQDAPSSRVDISSSGFTMQRNAGLPSLTPSNTRRLAQAALCLLFLSGCSTSNLSGSSSAKWLDSGALALSRPLPKRGPATSTQIATSAPVPNPTSSSEAAQIIISRRDNTLTAVMPGTSPLTFKAEGAALLPQGSFAVTVKEEAPLWYAPREYFTSRALDVPSEGSRSRFRRAALGSRAMYLDNQTPIHSGPVWLKEIGGLRVKQTEMERIYSMVTVGTRVEVR
jgi:hypothetical protein